MYPFMFIFILSFKLTIKVYPSTFLHVHRYTCSVYFSFFNITRTMTFQLIYWGTYPQIHPKINLPVYPHASLSSDHKDLPVTTTTCVPAHTCICLWPYMLIFILSFWLSIKIHPSVFLLHWLTLFIFIILICLTTKTYLSSQLLCTYPYMYPFMTLPVHFHTLIQINR